MAARTLSSTWKNFEKLSKKLFDSESPNGEITAINDLSERTNNSKICDAIATLFVQSHQGMENVTVEFLATADFKAPTWATSFSIDDKKIIVNPLGIFLFQQECRACVKRIKTRAARDSFLSYRYCAYLAELRKLPSQHLMFLNVLNEVAHSSEISKVEKKGGDIELAEDERYMNLLWAFNQLEKTIEELQGVNLRSKYSILWYESDWIIGKKRK